MLDSFLPFFAFVAGIIVGLLVAFALRLIQTKNAESLANQLFAENEKRRQAEQQMFMTTVQNNFGKLSMAVLNKSSQTFLQMAEQRLNTQTVKNSAELESKKSLIDQQLNTMVSELNKVTSLVKDFEADRIDKFSALSKEITSLTQTSTMIQRALADSRSRGQWGERIAEDILRLAGFIEGVNYQKQVSLESSRPDYTFLLPKNLTLNMDVKFPLDNYMRFINATANVDQEKYRKDFMRDVRTRVDEVVKRGYINTEQSTIDCVLIFIPNEQIYRFIHEEDNDIIENALSKKVILCSPLTLFIVLAIVRQAAENFALEKSSKEILAVLNDFKKQWRLFANKMNEVERHLNRTTEAYRQLTGRRTVTLERSFQKLDMFSFDLESYEKSELTTPDENALVLEEGLFLSVEEDSDATSS